MHSTMKTFKFAFLTLLLPLAAMAQTTYTITGSDESFTATYLYYDEEEDEEGEITLATGTITDVITAIKSLCVESCEIKFGNGTSELEIGTTGIIFDNAVAPKWGNITLSGRISSTNATATILLTSEINMESNADISNEVTGGSAIRKNTGAGTLTISGGTVKAGIPTAYAVYNASTTGSIVIAGGTISATTNPAVNNYVAGSIVLSGNPTVTGRIAKGAGSLRVSEFSPGAGKTYTLEFSSYSVNTLAVTDGGAYAENFTLANPDWGVVNSSGDLVMAYIRPATVYVITGSDGAFTASKGETTIATGAIQAVINGIQSDLTTNNVPCSIVDCTVQFGSGGAELDIKAAYIEFGTNWNAVLTGRISSENQTYGTILLSSNANINNKANVLNETTGGAAIRHSGTGMLTISDGTVRASSGTTAYAVYNSNTGTVNITGGTVSTTGTSANAVYNASSGKIIVSGTANITSANASVTSGTISIASGVTTPVNERLLIEGGSITNTAVGGHAVYNASVGSATISGGSITKTVAGNAVHNASSGALTISNGAISATTGSAVYNASTSLLTISGGSITSENTATGTVNIASTATTQVTGGIISNSATGGNAVYKNSTGSIDLGGAPIITGYIKLDNGLLEIIGSFEPGSNIYTIAFASYGIGNLVSMGGGGHIANFALANNDWGVTPDDVYLRMYYKGLPKNYVITSSSSSFIATRRDTLVYTGTIQAVIDAIKADAVNVECQIQFGDGTNELNIGTSYINFSSTGWGQITLIGKITSQSATTLDNSANVISNADIGNNNSSGIAILNNSGTLNITGGTVSATAGGNAIRQSSSGTVNISGGTVSAETGNAVYQYGGGVINVLPGANITSANTATGTINLVSGYSTVRLAITGGTIANTAANGNAIYNASAGAINLSGTPTITGKIMRASTGNLTVIAGFVPSDKYYTLDFSSYSGTAVESGGTFIESFIVANSGYGLTEGSGNALITAYTGFNRNSNGDNDFHIITRTFTGTTDLPDVISAIQSRCKEYADGHCGIQFGDGTRELNISTSSVNFNDPDWHVTLSGKITSSNAPVPVTTTIFNEDFEGTNSFTIVNSTQPNQWWVGTVTNNGGTKSAYISNTSGSTNNYNTSSTSVVHMYRDVTFPANATGNFTLSFNWKGAGESGYDYLTVHLVETTTTLTAGTALTINSIGSSYQGYGSTWQTVNINLSAATYAGTTKRLVFTWRNDGVAGTNPPVAIDNITLTGTVPGSVGGSTIQLSNGASVKSSADIRNSSANGVAIANTSTGTLTINGGTISAINNAIYNSSTGSILLGGNPTITGKITNASTGTLSVITDEDIGTVFAPGTGKTYTLDFAPSYYDLGNVALENGADFEDNFTLANEDWGLAASEGNLVMVKHYRVSFSLNGGPGTPPADITGIAWNNAVPIGKKPETEGFTRAGYVNDGKWYTTIAGTTEFEFGTTLVTENITLYLKWVQAYTVSFNLNGGDGIVPASISVPAGSTIPEDQKPSTEDFTYPNRISDGEWYTTSTGTTKFEFGVTPVTASTTLYLKWFVPNAATPTITSHPTNREAQLGGSSSGPRSITVRMHDSSSDGWDGGGALRISVNGTYLSTNPRLADGSSGTYTFSANTGDIIRVYWHSGDYLNENAFAIYYTDAPPSPAFNPIAGSSNNTAALLVYKLYGSLSSTISGEQLGSFTVSGGTIAPISVTANVSDGGMLSYQWYSNTTASNEGGEAITGATSAQYTPSTATAGTFYYYVEVTNTNTNAMNSTATIASNVSTFIVLPPIAAATPVITMQPLGDEVSTGTPRAVSVAASASDAGILSYQWYSIASNGTATAITGATNPYYTVPTSAAGTFSYYVVVTNSNANGTSFATVESEIATITVNARNVSPTRLPQIASNLRVQATNNAILLENLPKTAKIEVYNQKGMVVHSQFSTLNSQLIPINAKGVYIVKINNQTLNITVR